MEKANKRGRKPKTADYNNVFAVRLRELIEEKGVTQQQISENISPSRQALNKWVNGETIPDILAAAELADYFGVSLDYLTGRGKTRSSDEDIAIACKVTGLSEKAILKLADESKKYECSEKTFERLGICPDEETEYGMGYFLEMRNKIILSRCFDDVVFACGVLYGHSGTLLGNNGFFSDDLEEICEKFGISKTICRECVRAKIQNQDLIFSEIYEESCDVQRYKILKATEKISDMFDRRAEHLKYSREELLNYLGIDEEKLIQMQKEASENGKHNHTP